VAEPEGALRSDVADLRATIERAAADLAVADEPAGFTAALDAGAPPAEDEAAS
jgi:hypothetical protein